MEMSNSNMSIKLKIAIVLLIVAVLLIIFCPNSGLMIPFSIIGILLTLGVLVLNFIAKKEIKKDEKKGIYTLCNIFGILVLIFCLLELIGTILMANPDLNEVICQREDMVSDCVDQGEGFSSCKYMKQIDIPCNTDVLEESQIK